jgi:DNA-binding NtrC family response regulator
MNQKLIGKRILAVDDEPDVLETVVEFLDMCTVETATDFESAKQLLTNNQYDAAILDIMGVNGYDLLNIAESKGIPALMLTAHALTPAHLEKSIGNGAYCYLPKERMIDITTYLSDVLVAKEDNRGASRAWFERLAPDFERQWGSDWKKSRMDALRRLNLVASKEELEEML